MPRLVQDMDQGWDAARLKAVGELLRALPSSCGMLALNGGAAEALAGVCMPPRRGLASAAGSDGELQP